MRILVCLFCVFLAGCGATLQPYEGPDSGYVAVGIGAAKGTTYSSYSLLIREQSPDAKSPSAYLSWQQINSWGKVRIDYDTAQDQGSVVTQSLRPGLYEISNFDVFYNGGMTQVNFGSREPFSIPFEIKPGRVTYLGNFQANGLEGRNMFGMRLPQGAGVVFVVESRMDTDLAFARKLVPTLPADAFDGTPGDVAAIGSPFFVAPGRFQSR